VLDRELTSNLPWRLKISSAIWKPAGLGSPGTATAQLTIAMVEKNEDAYREFFECYFDRLLRYLIVCARGDEELAREALQLTFIRIVRYLKPIDSEDRFWSWLTVLARSALADEQRKRRTQLHLLHRILQRGAPAEPEMLEPEVKLIPALAESLAELDSEERQLIDEKYFKTLSVREIAAGASEKAIESKLGRIRRKLKSAILNRLKRED
jgi:RNA polymerase sigma-70 factor (ECF subfamily)